MRLARILLFVVALMAVTVPAAGQAVDPSVDPSTTRLVDGLSFSVSLSVDPIAVKAGDKVETTAQVSNGSNTATAFTLKIISVDVADEGVVKPAEQREDAISKAVTVAPNVAVDAGATVGVPITITVPDELDPDIYFAGLLVQPANVTPTAGDQTTINRLLNVIAVDVFGAQTRGVEVGFPDHSRFALAEINDSYAIANRNAGVSVSRKVSISGWLTDETVLEDTTATASDGTRRTSFDTIARGHKKTFDYKYSPGLLTLDVVKPSVSVTFSDAGVQRTFTEVGPATLVISPLVLAIVVILFAGLVVAVIFLVRKRRARKSVGNRDAEAKDGAAID